MNKVNWEKWANRFSVYNHLINPALISETEQMDICLSSVIPILKRNYTQKHNYRAQIIFGKRFTHNTKSVHCDFFAHFLVFGFNLWWWGVFAAASVTLNQYHTFESQIIPDVTFACVRLCVTIVMMCHKCYDVSQLLRRVTLLCVTRSCVTPTCLLSDDLTELGGADIKHWFSFAISSSEYEDPHRATADVHTPNVTRKPETL